MVFSHILLLFAAIVFIIAAIILAANKRWDYFLIILGILSSILLFLALSVPFVPPAIAEGSATDGASAKSCARQVFGVITSVFLLLSFIFVFDKKSKLAGFCASIYMPSLIIYISLGFW